MPDITKLASHAHTGTVDFPLCAFGADVQKFTTLMSSPRLHALLRPLHSLRYTHTTHKRHVGGTHANGKWVSAAFAAYPADLNLYLARVLASLVVPIHEFEADAAVATADTRAKPSPSAPAEPDTGG